MVWRRQPAIGGLSHNLPKMERLGFQEDCEAGYRRQYGKHKYSCCRVKPHL